MQPFLAVATLLAAVTVANSETAYLLQPVQRSVQRDPRAGLTTGWGWRPVKTYTLALPSISLGWGGGKQGGGGWGGWGGGGSSGGSSGWGSGISVGLYGGLRIGPKQQQQGWGKQQTGWGWGHGGGGGGQGGGGGWGWKPQQHGWGWDGGDGGDDDDDHDDLRADVHSTEMDLIEGDDASSEEVADDEASASVESDESAEADSPYDYRRSVVYNPYFA